MLREQHLEFCTICQNRGFDPKNGVICKLTGQIADFEGECESFEKDDKEEAKVFKTKMERAGDTGSGHSSDFEKNKTNGTIFLAIGVAVLLFTFTMDSIPVIIIPIGAIIYGYSVYSKGVEQEKLWKADQEKRKQEEDQLGD